jgi:hypothetical protein
MDMILPSSAIEGSGLTNHEIPIQVELGQRRGALMAEICHRIVDITCLFGYLNIGVYDSADAVDILICG